jgi:hypothetical protein
METHMAEMIVVGFWTCDVQDKAVCARLSTTYAHVGANRYLTGRMFPLDHLTLLQVSDSLSRF